MIGQVISHYRILEEVGGGTGVGTKAISECGGFWWSFARCRQGQKRGAGAIPVSLDGELLMSEERADLVALDDALKALAAIDPRKCRVLGLRFFGGLSVEEAAEVLKVSPGTVMRDWKLAKVWLLREMREEKHHEP